VLGEDEMEMWRGTPNWGLLLMVQMETTMKEG
jgi:hypothetical protein